MYRSYCVQSLKKQNIDFIIWHFSHRHPDIVTISTKIIFHIGKCEFYRVVVGGVWGKKLATHSPVWYWDSACSLQNMTHLSRISAWISGCLCIRQLSITTTELAAGYGCIYSRSPSMKLVNVSVQKDPSTISQWRIPLSSDSAGRTENLEAINHPSRWKCQLDIPSTAYKEGLPLSMSAPNWPSISSVCCPTIYWAFIYKNELVHLIHADPWHIVKTLRCRTFNCNPCDLPDRLENWDQDQMNTYLLHGETCLFECPPYSWIGDVDSTSHCKNLAQFIQVQIWCLSDGAHQKLVQSLQMRV